jgi:SNF2 family DNA or RNA helicase
MQELLQNGAILQQTQYPHTNSRSLLHTIDIVFRRQLQIDAELAPQPPDVKLPLRQHQRALIHAMVRREEESRYGIPYFNTNTFTNYGVLGDEVGSGKSLVILGFISHMKRVQQIHTDRTQLLPHSRTNFFSIVMKPSPETCTANLIIVPHTLFRQWQEYCSKQTTLKAYFVKSSRDLYPSAEVPEENVKEIIKKTPKKTTKKNPATGASPMTESVPASTPEPKRTIETIVKEMKEADVVLVSNTLYSELADFATTHRIQWRRCFMDEVDTIHIVSTTPALNVPFTWYVSATWHNFVLEGCYIRPTLLDLYNTVQHEFTAELGKWLKAELGVNAYHGLSYGRSTYLSTRSYRWLYQQRNDSILRGLNVLLCSPELLELSRQMPPIHEQSILCLQPETHKAVQGLVSSQVMAMLHAGNVQEALKELGVHSNTTMGILQAVEQERSKELDRLQKTFEFKEKMEYHTPQAKEQALSTLKAKIASVQEQLKTFKERIANISSEGCPICYDDPQQTQALLTPCCSRIFCGSCIIQSLARTTDCPMCRHKIMKGQLIHLVEKKTGETNTKNEPKVPTKQKALLTFLKENPSARVLVFCRYENPFVQLEADCDMQGITYHTLRGNKDVIASTIRSFEKGEKRVLFLPTATTGAGLNLQSASHVVLLHAMTPEEEKQAVGRAYRLGRTEPLTVVRLLHEGETSATAA